MEGYDGKMIPQKRFLNSQLTVVTCHVSYSENDRNLGPHHQPTQPHPSYNQQMTQVSVICSAMIQKHGTLLLKPHY